jgi:hypothetical protein
LAANVPLKKKIAAEECAGKSAIWLHERRRVRHVAQEKGPLTLR